MIYQPVPTAAPPASRTDFVLESIKGAILNGELRPGQALVEAELAARLAVSKTPVREALKTLAGSGLVAMSPYKGASVRIVDAELVRAVYEVRVLMEPEALRRAVRRKADLSEARDVLAEAQRVAKDGPDQGRMSLINRRFHRAMYAGCGNPLMVAILDDLRDQTALITVAGWGIRPTWKTEIDEHRAVLLAAEQGDADRAAELMRRHIQMFADRVVEGLPDGTG
ncbi:MAG TPA: GntR family transcriptional regulator [Actinophytocola sp.]|uniref:GntR family transcriptional regulator n=1 Tax=Actinophytocola sp. TaxID=1872138 RepID=UPI002DDCEC8B|nr:GntR family transcriptional regulator [Actinophytocola sp.]HEV2780078.1 GntR family transcriptional regulator [Actinophytocola sp.]